MRHNLSNFLRCESGATAIEYGLIASLIGMAVVTSIGLISDSLTVTFQKVLAGFH
jgi:pilus assembly protein Flp/PilA